MWRSPIYKLLFARFYHYNFSLERKLLSVYEFEVRIHFGELSCIMPRADITKQAADSDSRQQTTDNRQ